MLPLFLLIGAVFGALGAASAYVISYSEYRRHRLKPGQSARRMALDTAGVTFVVFFLGAVVLSFLLSPDGP